MAKIPQFEANQLASSLVGTPGVDTSGATLAGRIANDAGQLVSAQQDVNSAVNAENVRKLHIAESAQRERTQQLEAHITANNVAIITAHGKSDMNQLLVDANQKNMDNPQEGVNQLKSAFPNYIQNLTAGIDDPDLKMQVQTGLINHSASLMDQAQNHSFTQQALNTQGQVESLQATLVNQAGKPKLSDSDLNNIMKTWNGAAGLIHSGYGEKADKIHHDGLQAIVQASLDQRRIDNPQQLINDLKSGKFLMVDAGKRAELQKLAEQDLFYQKRGADLHNTITIAQKRNNMAGTIINTNMKDMGSINGALSSTQKVLNDAQTELKNDPTKTGLVPFIHETSAMVEKLQKAQQQFATKQATEQRFKDKQIFDSKEALISRRQLDVDFINLKKDMEAEKDPSETLKEVDAFQHKLHEAISKGYMKDPESTGAGASKEYFDKMNIWHKGLQDETNEFGYKVHKAVTDVLPDWFPGSTNRDSMHSALQSGPSAQGKSHAQTVDVGMRHYDDVYNSQKTRLEQHLGRPVTVIEQKNLHDMVFKDTIKKVHGGQ